MNTLEERALVRAAEKMADALLRLAKVFEDRFGQSSPLAQAVASAVEKPPAGSALNHIIELAHSIRLNAREQFALPVKVCVEVDEQHWPQLIDHLRATPEWAYSSGRGDRPCEAELGDVVFRADLR